MTYVKKKLGSKQEIAYQYIKNAIQKNEFKPDTMLIEGNLAQALSFSKTPVREALRRLASGKFVEFIAEKGTFVSRMSLEDLIELFDVREALEGMAARMCALRKDQTAIKQLKEVLKRIYFDLQEGKNSENVMEDMAFHNILIYGSRNSNLINFSIAILDQINRFAATTIDDLERLRLSYGEHKNVLDAIVNGDADEAEKAIREHIKSVKEYHINRHYLLNSSY